MKKIRTGVFVYLLILVCVLGGCYIEPVPTFDTGEIEGMKPVYEEDLMVQRVQSQTLVNPGKILSYGPLLLVTELGKGIHVYDNSNPANPVNLFFLEVFANNDITIKNGLLYLDNGPDLLSIKVTTDTLIEVSRIRSLTETNQPDLSEFPSENNVYYECPDSDKGPVVFWRRAILTDPKCFKRR